MAGKTETVVLDPDGGMEKGFPPKQDSSMRGVDLKPIGGTAWARRKTTLAYAGNVPPITGKKIRPGSIQTRLS